MGTERVAETTQESSGRDSTLEKVPSSEQAARRPASAVARALGGTPGGFFARYAVVLALLAMIAAFSIAEPTTFATTATLKSILVTQAPLLVMALALTFVLATGEFDLSIGAVLGISATVLAYLSSTQAWSPGTAVLATLGLALLIGAINGAFVVLFRVNSFIATLGMGTLISGVALAIAGSTTIGGVPDQITDPVRAEVGGIDLAVIYGIVLVIIGWYVMEHTPLGRYLFFTGEGREAARLAGIRVNRIRFGALVVSALGAWLAGVLLAGQTGAANTTVGEGYILPAFAAAFLGATTIKPGRFNAWGTLVAVYLLAVGTTGLQLLGAADWVTDVFNGAALVLAVTLASLASRKRD